MYLYTQILHVNIIFVYTNTTADTISPEDTYFRYVSSADASAVSYVHMIFT